MVTAFLDGDRGGELILKELLQLAEVDFIARAPRGREVEELTQKQIMKCLRNKMPAEQFLEMYNIANGVKPHEKEVKKGPSQVGGQVPQQVQPRPKEPRFEKRSLTPELEQYKKMLGELSHTSKARLVDNDGKVTEVAVKDLIDRLKDNKDVKVLVFDGIITQRILDLAVDIGLGTVVGTKIGNVTKQPTDIEVWTKDKL